MMKPLTYLAVASAVTLLTHSAAAVSLTEHSTGLKLLAGADLWSSPSNIPGNYEGLGFAGTAGGVGYGAAAYYELRLIKFIGLEVDLAYQHGAFYRTVTLNQVVDIRETVTTNALRLPVLAKLNIPIGLGRIWLGAGPEFTLTQSSSAKLEQTSGPAVAILGTEKTKDVKPIFGTAGLGLVIEIPLVGIEIPLELRASRNLSQPADFFDRISPESASSVTVRAESTWVLRLGAGIGLQF